MPGLTAHVMVRNEPLCTYAVRAIYPYVDCILLYDTGSYDTHTLDDIQLLLAEDVDHKVRFEQHAIEYDETKWTHQTYQKMADENLGRKGKGYIRQQMIEDTKTPFFIVVDGDEVYRDETMLAVRRALDKWPGGKIAGYVPWDWYCDPKHVFARHKAVGRVWMSRWVVGTLSSPNETVWSLTDRREVLPTSPCSFQIRHAPPYAHFETMLKPWRRPVPPDKVQPAPLPLPRVMREDRSFLERWQSERSSSSR